MRIGFTGTGGAGKTTTLNSMVKADPTLPPVLLSRTRRVFERWGLTESQQEDMSPEDRWLLQKDIFSSRLEAESECSDFISDRTILDSFAYCIHRCYQVIDDTSFHELKSMVIDNLIKYDVIIYFPITTKFNPPDDGMRQQGFAYRYQIDSLIKSVLIEMLDRDMTSKIHILRSTDLNDRTEEIRQYIRFQEFSN